MVPADTAVPVAWSIAGSDSGSGAGIQVDIKVMNAFGVHACTVISALTAQNTLGVHSVEPVSEMMLRAQLEALKADLPPTAIKTGMLGSASTCSILAEFFSSLPAPRCPLVCDPILKSTSGADLLDPEALNLLIHGIFPHVSVLTPNIPEAQKLLGRPGSSIEEAAALLLGMGVASVLIKGGHTEGNTCRDYWTDGKQSMWLASPRIETHATHGTGCILSSAIASGLALGKNIPDAIIDAKTFLNQCLRTPANTGTGIGPMWIGLFENREEDRPTLQ